MDDHERHEWLEQAKLGVIKHLTNQFEGALLGTETLTYEEANQFIQLIANLPKTKRKKTDVMNKLTAQIADVE